MLPRVMINETRFKGLGREEERRLAPLIMLSSPSAHEPISITVNDADVTEGGDGADLCGRM